MNISSMSGAELFTTLTGKAPVKPILDVVKEANASKSVTKLDGSAAAGNTGASNRDVFVRSSKEIDPETDSFERLMQYDNELKLRISAGITKEQLATHFGDMAKRLDEAYAQGKFTESEYNELNAGLMESFDNAITKCERRAASCEVIKENMRARQAGLAAGTSRPRSKTNIEKILEGMGVYGKDANELTEEEAMQLRDLLDAMEKAEKDRKEKEEKEEKSSVNSAGKDNSEDEDFLARLKEVTDELDRQVTDFASKYCRTDRAAMRNMLDIVRKGGELPGGRDKTYGGARHETWFTDGYVSKPYL
ncbi:MAG: hypothetical protein K2N72_13165 [Oscillospiraceae bacterium]|nr:hypothetical protein [Oscillospiraceae bacterium]